MVAFGSGRGTSVSVNSAAGISPSVFPPRSTHHAVFGVRDYLDFDDLVLRRGFLRFAILVDELAHLLRASGFFCGSRGFRVRCRRLRMSFRRFVSLFGLHRRPRRAFPRHTGSPAAFWCFRGCLFLRPGRGLCLWCGGGCCRRYGVFILE